MKNLLTAAMIPVFGIAAACSDSEPDYEFEPIVSSTLDGHLRGEELSFDAGIATAAASGVPVFVLGVGNINCDSFAANAPRPQGTYAYVVPGPLGTELAVQTYEDAYVNLESYDGRSMNLVGSDGATVSITEVTPTTVAGSISFAYVYEGNELGALAGDFAVTRCP
jgi:hypothetical protein